MLALPSDLEKRVTHAFPLEAPLKAHDTFANAAPEGAVEVILRRA
jgi:hypothetical protein